MTRLNYLLPLKNDKVIDLKTLEIRQRTEDENFTFELEFESPYLSHDLEGKSKYKDN